MVISVVMLNSSKHGVMNYVTSCCTTIIVRCVALFRILFAIQHNLKHELRDSVNANHNLRRHQSNRL